MNRSRRTFLMGSAALATSVAFHLGSQTGSRAQGSGQRQQTVNLYSARHYDTDAILYENFSRKTGITVNLVEANADALIERIKSEGVNSPADVFITVDAGRLWRAQESGILQPITSPILAAAVPKALRDPSGHWVGLSERARVILYNRNRVNPADLSTYEDLANPRWKGKIVVRSSSNIYNQSLVGSLLAVHGPQKTEEWVRGLVANFARPPQGNDTALIKAVAAGVGDLTLVNTYYLARLAHSKDAADRDTASQVGLFFPNQRDRGAHINISGGGVVKTAPHREAAIQFLEYLVSQEAQEVFAKSNREYPVIAGVSLDPVLEHYGPFKPDLSVNAAEFGKNNAAALKIMDRAGWI